MMMGLAGFIVLFGELATHMVFALFNAGAALAIATSWFSAKRADSELSSSQAAPNTLSSGMPNG